MTRAPASRRPGFTLIELLIVIIVIGILIALLVPAIIGAQRTAFDAATIAEEQQMVNALNAFKEKFNSYPPSRIMLNETLPFQQYGSIAGSNAIGDPMISSIWLNANAGPPAGVTATTLGNDITAQQLAQRSGNYMLKFFPRARAPFMPPSGATVWNDFNGNGSPDYATFGSSSSGWIYLEGHECLVFFLGGIANLTKNTNGSTTAAMTGLGRDLTAPFTYPGDSTPTFLASFPNLSPQMVSLNRQPSFFEWNSGRLGDADLDTMLDYADFLTSSSNASNLTTGVASQVGGNDVLRTPYAYFSAYEGAGYDPNDVNGNETTSNLAGPLAQKFRVTLGLTSGVTQSASPNPYTVSAAVPSTGTPASYQNPNTFQLISAGRDRVFGLGGQYTTNATPRLIYDSLNSSPADPGLRGATESDNLTNFNSSKLD